MSLVNDVLKDLESRGHKGVSAEHLKPVTVSDVGPRARKWMSLLFVIVLCAAVLGAYGYYIKFIAEPVESLPYIGPPALDQPIADEQVTPTVEVTEKETKRLITSIEINHADRQSTLLFNLSHPSHVVVNKQKTKEIVLGFGDIYTQTTLPSYDPALIEKVEVYRRDNQLLLELVTKSAAQFTLNSASDTRWQLGITLLNTTPPAEDVSAQILPTSPTVTAKVNGRTELNLRATPDAVTPVDVEKKAVLPPKVKPLEVAAPPVPAKPIKASAPPAIPATPKAEPVLLHDETVERQAKQLIKNSQTEQAKVLLVKAISESADNMRSRVVLASLHLQSNQTEEAERLVTEGLKYAPHSPELKSLLARIKIDQGDAKSALALLSEALPPIDSNEQYHELLAVSQQKTGDYGAAAKTYYSLLQKYSNNPRHWVGLGYALEKEAKLGDARTAYSAAMRVPSISASLKQFVSQRLKQLPER